MQGALTRPCISLLLKGRSTAQIRFRFFSSRRSRHVSCEKRRLNDRQPQSFGNSLPFGRQHSTHHLVRGFMDFSYHLVTSTSEGLFTAWQPQEKNMREAVYTGARLN
jgi:hypothetical protein